MASSPIFFCLRFLCFAFAIIGTHAQGGTWDIILQNAGIASMHAAVTRWNTVVLLDRTDTGASNMSLPAGAPCRVDPNDLALPGDDCSAHSVLLDLQTNTVRPLTIQTDTWCSSGQFLPDGTLLQSGGWNDGNLKFRTFVPCINTGSCDWVELGNATLSQGRWYATNQILPDGTIIIVGGISVSSLEYYPPTGGAVNFPFVGNVADNEGDNLYPYVHLLPNGYLFIFANNQSVLYNYRTNVVVTTYPILEGGPRNYPSAGSSVMLALKGDYSTATIVICGGAQYDAYNNQDATLPAIGSCGRIVATDPNPFWEMDQMPFVRNMGEMVMLPTGDVVIINGAQAGSQGFGLATNAALNPVLYKPDKALGSRFTTLNPSTIPRVYHSTANLLPDGRILLAGSNTHWAYTWDGVFPTELRIDAFSPDYLSAGNKNLRPVLVKVPKQVLYGKEYNVYVTLAAAPVDGQVEVNFASAPYSTHSFSQGQRLIKMAITRSIMGGGNNEYRIVFRAPPNGMVAPPGYYMMFVVNQGIPSVARWVPIVLS